MVDGSALRRLRNRCVEENSGYRVGGLRACVAFFCLARKEWAMRGKACNDQITFPVFDMKRCFVRGFVGTSVYLC